MASSRSRVVSERSLQRDEHILVALSVVDLETALIMISLHNSI